MSLTLPCSNPNGLHLATTVSDVVHDVVKGEDVPQLFYVGQLVNVASRTWPGINQPGGVGRITGTSTVSSIGSEKVHFVSVRYVIDNRHEKEIDCKYVEPYNVDITRPTASKNSLRDRTMLLGRCQRCGSLRADCGSCDFRWTSNHVATEPITKRTWKKRSSIQYESSLITSTLDSDNFSCDGIEQHSCSSETSSDNDSLNEMISEYQRRYRKFKSLKARFQNAIHDDRLKRKIKTKETIDSILVSASSNLSDCGETNFYSDTDTSNGEDETLSDLVNLCSLRRHTKQTGLSRKFKFSSSKIAVPKASRNTTLHASLPGSNHASSTRIIVSSPSAKPSRSSDDSYNDDKGMISPTSSASIEIVGTQDLSPSQRLGTSLSPVRYGSSESETETDQHSLLRTNLHTYDTQPLKRCKSSFTYHTDQLTYQDIVPLLDAIASKLEKDTIPHFKLQVYVLEQEYRNSIEKQTNLTKHEKEIFEKKCQDLYDLVIHKVVQDELDQYRRGLRNLSRKPQQRQNELTSSGAPLNSNLWSDIDLREFRFDAITSTIEELVSRVRTLCLKAADKCSALDFFDEDDEDGSSSGWASPTNLESQIPSFNFEASPSEIHIPSLSLQNEDPLDSHPYATKKRKSVVRRTHDSRREGSKENLHPKLFRSHVINKSKPVPHLPSNFSRSRKKSQKAISLSVLNELPTNRLEEHVIKKRSRNRINTHRIVNSDSVDGQTELPDSHESKKRPSLLAPSVNPRRNHNERLDSSSSYRPMASSRLQESYLIESNNERPDDLSWTCDQPSSAQSSSILSSEVLYASLLDRCVHEQTELKDFDHYLLKDIDELCLDLVEVFPKTESIKLMHVMCSRMIQSTTLSQIHAEKVFGTILIILRRSGNRTLQDVITSTFIYLTAHVGLLTSLVTLFKAQTNQYLTESSGDCFLLFGKDNCDRLLNYIVLQLVDAVLAISIPSVWAFPGANNKATLAELEPLRNALSSFLPFIEKASHCILRDLECQNWYCVRGGEHAFVSSVNPAEWELFLTSCSNTRKPSVTWLATLGKYLPRGVVDGIWVAFAYFAKAPTNIQSNGTSRWGLVTRIMDSTVPKELTIVELPPSKQQTLVVCSEIRNLTMLLLSGVIGSLPRQDSLLIDILMKAIHLQGYAILHTEHQRLKCYPEVTKRKNMLRNLLRGVSFVNIEHDENLKPLELYSLSLGIEFFEPIWIDQHLCFPSTTVLRLSLGLLIAWTSQIPSDESNRRVRLQAATKRLIHNLVEASADSSRNVNGDHNVGATHDNLFLETFGTGATTGNDGVARQKLFLLECALHLTITAHVSIEWSKKNFENGCFDVGKTCEDAWYLIADEIMRDRQRHIAQPEKKMSSLATFKGDSHRLHVAFKGLLSLAFFSLGSLPTHDTLNEHNTRTFLFDSKRIDVTSFVFVLTCLLACLDCCCDTHHNIVIIASTAGSLSCLLKAFCFRIMGDQPQNTHDLRLAIRGPIVNAIVKLFERAIQLVTRLAFCGQDEDCCIRSLLALLQWTLRAAELCAIEPAQDIIKCNQSNDTFEDEFGGIDDDVLARIDLAAQISLSDKELIAPIFSKDENIRNTFFFLLECLENGKPSVRFCIENPDLLNMSVQGKSLVWRHEKSICACLAQIAVSSLCKPLEDIKLLKKPTSSLLPSDPDAQYERQMRIHFTQGLCKASNLTKGQEFVRFYADGLMSTLIEACMDLNVLCKLPSCNLDGIRQQGGESAEKLAFTALLRFVEGSNSALRENLLAIHSFCKNVGLSLLESDATAPEKLDWLQAWKVDDGIDDNWKLQLKPSLEMELFDYFRLFRRILMLAESGEFSIEYDNLAVAILTSMAFTMMQLIDRLELQQEAQSDCCEQSCAYTVLCELFVGVTDLFASVLSLVLQSHRSLHSSFLSKYIYLVWTGFLAPLLKQPNFDLRLGLLNLLNDPSVLATEKKGSGMIIDEKLCEVLRYSFVKNSRSFFHYVLLSDNSSARLLSSHFLGDIFSFALKRDEVASCIVATSFSPKASYIELMVPNIPHSILQTEIVTYTSHIKDLKPLSDRFLNVLCGLKVEAYRRIIDPLISKTTVNSENKLPVVKLLKCMIDIENQSCDLSSEAPKMGSYLLCSLWKGLAMSLTSALGAGKVDAEMIQSVYECASSILSLPSSCVESNAVGQTIDWSYTMLLSDHYLTDSSQVCKGPEHARFFWYLCIWLKDLGMQICRTSPNDFDDVRKTLKDSVQTQSYSFEMSLPGQDCNVSNNLKTLSAQIFQLSPISISISNVYTCKNVISDVAFETWTPCSAVQQSIINYVSKVASATNYADIFRERELRCT